MLKFTFNALIQQLLLLWLRPLHTAEKHHPTMFHTATVRPTRSGPNLLYNTSLKAMAVLVMEISCQLSSKEKATNWFIFQAD